MAYTAENLEHAVSVFYSSEHNDRAEAHKWLTEAQRCPEAWSFVWQLLNSQKGTEIQFFAATTLHTKLQRCWTEVPSDKHEELKDRIMQAIAMFSNGPKIVLNRLCISLAAFILQRGGQGLLQIIHQLSNSYNASILLEVLSVLPEEFNSMTMPTTERSSVRANLQQLTIQILELVIKHLQIEGKELNASNWLWNVTIWQSACQCASAWIQLGGVTPIQCVPAVSSALHVLCVIYRGLNPTESGRNELSQTEIEACEGALNVAGAVLTQPDAGRHPTSCCHILRILLDIAEPILQVEDVLHALNEDLVVAIYSTLVAAGEFHARWVALSISEDLCDGDVSQGEQMQNKRESARCANDLLKLLLCCSGAVGMYPIQETHSKLSFSFWFTLQDEGLWSAGENSNSSHKVKSALRVWYEQLVGVLLRKSTIPPQSTELSSVDDELMRCYRQDVADTLVYCHTVLGNELVFQLETLMRSLAENCLADHGCTLEAVLHAFLALAEFVNPTVSRSLFSLMRILIELPYDDLHQQVLNTALGCFVAYADWLGNVGDPAVEEIVGRALNVTWKAIENKELTALGVLALKAFCQECNKYLRPHAHQLLQAIQAGQGKWASIVASQVMMAAGCTASTLPVSEAEPYLTNLTTPIVEKLQLARKPQLSAKKLSICTTALLQASSLLSSLTKSDVKHVYTPLSLLLPTFEFLVQHTKLTEPLFKLIKLVITRLGDDCIPLLEALIRVTNASLELEPNPATIDVCKMIFLMYTDVGGDTFRIAVISVLKVCSETVGQGQSLSIHAPLLDTFYSSLAAILNKKSQVLQYTEHQMQDIIQLGLLTLCLPEQNPPKSACSFFGNLARVCPVKLLPHTYTLIRNVVHCIGILSPRNHIDPFADLLWKFGRLQCVDPLHSETSIAGPALLSTSLKEALQEPGFPTDLATPEVKEKFIKNIVKNSGHKRRVLEVVREFALSCRGLLGTYGEMTQPLDNF